MISNRATTVFGIAVAFAAWIGFPITLTSNARPTAVLPATAVCPSGHSAARLTGWMLNGKRPVGHAAYNESTKLLDVSVESVGLPDGTRLAVFIGEERVGELEPLKDGKAQGKLTRQVAENARVRVFDAERPIVSENLACVEAPSPEATVSPTSTPTATPTATPSPSPSPSIPAEPTPDPMPKPSPEPTPSPVL